MRINVQDLFMSVADQYIKTGMYKNVLVIGSEVHSTGLDMTSRGRGVSVILEMEQEQPF
jgi:3-oxoacyl-[acyl-carrier-protein] synthase III